MSSALAEPAPSAARPSLSPREVEVLRAWLTSESKEAAARSLFVAPTTVTTHISRIRAKYASAGRPATCKARLLAATLRDGYIGLDAFDKASAV